MKFNLFVLLGILLLITPTVFAGSWWSAWTSMPSKTNGFFGTPSVVNINPQRLEVFASGFIDNQVWHAWHNEDKSWSSWTQLGSVCTAHSPVAKNMQDGRIIVFVRGCDGNLYVNWMLPNRGWSGWRNKGGCIRFSATPIALTPAAMLPDGNFEVFARKCDTTDSILMHMWSTDIDNDQWHSWEDMGPIDNPPAATTAANGDIYAVGQGNPPTIANIWKRDHVTETWSTWEYQLSAAPSNTLVPWAVFPWGSSISLTYTGTNNNLYINNNNFGGSHSYQTPGVAVVPSTFYIFTRSIQGMLQLARNVDTFDNLGGSMGEGYGPGVGVTYVPDALVEVFTIDASHAMSHIWGHV